MKFKVGQEIKIVTKTVNDAFGAVYYRVAKVNQDTPDGVNDGVSLYMLGGTGPAAREGMTFEETERSLTALFKGNKASFQSKPDAIGKEGSVTHKARVGGCHEIDL